MRLNQPQNLLTPLHILFLLFTQIRNDFIIQPPNADTILTKDEMLKNSISFLFLDTKKREDVEEMNEKLKTIFEDYELKASELTTIKNQIYFILDNTTEIGENADNKSIKAYNYDRLQELLPSVADLLNYKIEEMHKNLDEYYNIKKETAV